jgi:cytochrome P450
MKKYMVELIEDRRASGHSGEHDDLFSSLLEASDAEMSDGALSQSELVGNIFIFLIAGHEVSDR